jgi:hypothetical protein
MTRDMDMEPGTIVQANPEHSIWGPAMVVVEQVKLWGVEGFTHVPRSGRAYIKLSWEEIEPTGGKAVFNELM